MNLRAVEDVFCKFDFKITMLAGVIDNLFIQSLYDETYHKLPGSKKTVRFSLMSQCKKK